MPQGVCGQLPSNICGLGWHEKGGRGEGLELGSALQAVITGEESMCFLGPSRPENEEPQT